MEIYARIRPRLVLLTLPMIWLFLISGVISFFSSYKLDTWQFYTLWTTALVAFVLGWLVPVLRFSAKFIDVTSGGILVRNGFGSKNTHDVAWTSLASVTASVRGLQFNLKDGSSFTVRGYAWPKTIAREIQSAL